MYMLIVLLVLDNFSSKIVIQFSPYFLFQETSVLVALSFSIKLMCHFPLKTVTTLC